MDDEQHLNTEPNASDAQAPSETEAPEGEQAGSDDTSEATGSENESNESGEKTDSEEPAA